MYLCLWIYYHHEYPLINLMNIFWMTILKLIRTWIRHMIVIVSSSNKWIRHMIVREKSCDDGQGNNCANGMSFLHWSKCWTLNVQMVYLTCKKSFEKLSFDTTIFWKELEMKFREWIICLIYFNVYLIPHDKI